MLSVDRELNLPSLSRSNVGYGLAIFSLIFAGVQDHKDGESAMQWGACALALFGATVVTSGIQHFYDNTTIGQGKK